MRLDGVVTMNPMYRAWWRALMDLRPLLRFLAERLPKLVPWTIRARSLAHLFVGNPIQTLAGLDAASLGLVLGWPARPLLIGFIGVVFVVEITHRVFYRSRCWLIGWREAWRFRRRWPSDWAGVAAKTARRSVSTTCATPTPACSWPPVSLCSTYPEGSATPPQRSPSTSTPTSYRARGARQRTASPTCSATRATGSDDVPPGLGPPKCCPNVAPRLPQCQE